MAVQTRNGQTYEATCVNLPSELKDEAKAAGINFSEALRVALRHELRSVVTEVKTFSPDNLGILIREYDGSIRTVTQDEIDAWHISECVGIDEQSKMAAMGYLTEKEVVLYVR